MHICITSLRNRHTWLGIGFQSTADSRALGLSLPLPNTYRVTHRVLPGPSPSRSAQKCGPTSPESTSQDLALLGAGRTSRF